MFDKVNTMIASGSVEREFLITKNVCAGLCAEGSTG